MLFIVPEIMTSEKFLITTILLLNQKKIIKLLISQKKQLD